MTGKGLPWTAAHLRTAQSPEEVRTAIDEAASHFGEGSIPSATVLALLEEMALHSAQLRTDLRGATRAREVLLASVAHDLRNPLNTFAMSAGLLRDDLGSPQFDQARALSLVQRMDRASGRMQALIEDLLEASRIESGAIEFTKRPEQASAIVEGAIAKASPLVKDKGAKLEASGSPDDAGLEVDKGRTVDALAKLVMVLLKTTGEGGVIRIGAEHSESRVVFKVRGNAPRGAKAANDERSGLAFLIGHGLVVAQGGEVATEAVQDGRAIVVSFPALA